MFGLRFVNNCTNVVHVYIANLFSFFSLSNNIANITQRGLNFLPIFGEDIFRGIAVVLHQMACFVKNWFFRESRLNHGAS